MNTKRTTLLGRRLSAKSVSRALAVLPLLGALGVPSAAHAAGLGNMTYTSAELFKPVSNFGGEGASKWMTGPPGANTAVMIRQKLVVMGSLDSGVAPGSLHVYDVTDPRKPLLQKTLDGTTETSKLRELHAMPVAMPDGKSLLVLPTTSGIQFFDFTDPLNPKPAGTFTLPGAAGGDYDGAVWMLSWEWPYVFAGGTNNGIFVVDATDPANCTLVTTLKTGAIGGSRIGPTYAAGNFLIGLDMDQTSGTTQAAIIDVSNPKTPVLLTNGTKIQSSLYSSLVIGDHIYGAGTNGDYVAAKWSANSVTTLVATKNGSDRGGYCTFQSPNLICGQSSEGFKKWDTTGDKLTFVGKGTDPNGVGGDFDFATIMGNLVFLGNDHGSGSALIPHQMAMDTVAPAVLKVYPSEANQKISSRITIFFTEDLDLDSVIPANITVRSLTGEVVPGVFSKSSFNAISFGPKAPLTANTTYEVSVIAGGVSDLVGNKITAASSTRFSTGATIDMTGMVPNGTAGAGAGGGAAIGGASADGGSTATSGGSAGSDTTAAGGTGGMVVATGTAGASGGAPPSASGGMPVTGVGGGSAGSTTTNPATPAADSGGCGCSVPGNARSVSAWALALGALGIGLGRLRGRKRQKSANQA